MTTSDRAGKSTQKTPHELDEEHGTFQHQMRVIMRDAADLARLASHVERVPREMAEELGLTSENVKDAYDAIKTAKGILHPFIEKYKEAVR